MHLIKVMLICLCVSFNACLVGQFAVVVGMYVYFAVCTRMSVCPSAQSNMLILRGYVTSTHIVGGLLRSNHGVLFVYISFVTPTRPSCINSPVVNFMRSITSHFAIGVYHLQLGDWKAI